MPERKLTPWMSSSVRRISRAPLRVVMASGSYHSRSALERQQERGQNRERKGSAPVVALAATTRGQSRVRTGRRERRTSSVGQLLPRKDRRQLRREGG